jgi:glycosyltransferase involved in cell wall biosynthesis
MVPTADPAGDYVVAIGRICPEKGLHLAVDAAEKAGMPLHLAGKVFPYADHIRYWREVLEPRLRPPHRFVGPVGIAQKAVLLGGARCLLVPSLVPETSSLIAMEALACGTPVVAFAAGALAEIVEPGRTGFLVHSTSEMAEAIRCVEALDRSECRNVACSRFSEQAMVAAYIKLYENLLQRSNDRAGR